MGGSHCIDLSYLNLLHIFFFFLLQADLVSSIGESAAMGTAGVVIWERSETKTEVHTVHKDHSMLCTLITSEKDGTLCEI